MASPDCRQCGSKVDWLQVSLALLLILPFCPCCVLWGCLWLDDREDRMQQRWEHSRIKKGMTPDEVREIVGEPGVIYNDAHWSYVIHNHYLVIWFKDGRVDDIHTASNLR
jgi:hypothetical protein